MRLADGSWVVLCLATLLGVSGGCGGTKALAPADAEIDHKRSTMDEVAEMLKLQNVNSKGKPPTKASELAKYEAGFQLGYYAVRDGNVVVLWGVPIVESASDKVIAYEKQALDSGGFVLMQDGTTVKQMTADELKSALKASK